MLEAILVHLLTLEILCLRSTHSLLLFVDRLQQVTTIDSGCWAML